MGGQGTVHQEQGVAVQLPSPSREAHLEEGGFRAKAQQRAALPPCSTSRAVVGLAQKAKKPCLEQDLSKPPGCRMC